MNVKIQRRLRYVLVGDGESPHLFKWARTLAPLVDLWVCSSRGVASQLAAVVAPGQSLALHTNPAHGGGNVALLRKLPEVARWLQQVDPDWINPHYLTSHGTLVLLARKFWRLRSRVLASAWGSDILVTPQRSPFYHRLTQFILRNADLCSSDSLHVTALMRDMGARNVLTFPFGLDALPPISEHPKQPWLFYANRGLEPIYQPLHVLEFFRSIATWQPAAQLVVANAGSQLNEVQHAAAHAGLSEQVRFVGHLSAHEQMHWYDLAQWYISLPRSDAVAVSVLEAMAHGCIPLLSDLPANRELVQDAHNGWIVPSFSDATQIQPITAETLPILLPHAMAIATHNRNWVQQHGLFGPAIERVVRTLQDFS